MFKKSFTLVFFILLETICCSKTLQAMYIPDLWEKVWEEEEERWRADQNNLFSNSFGIDDVSSEDLVKKIIEQNEQYYRLNNTEKTELVQALRVLSNEQSEQLLHDIKNTLESLCKKVNHTALNNLSSEKNGIYSITDLQELFEKSVDYKTRIQLIIEFMREKMQFINAHPERIGSVVGAFCGCLHALQILIILDSENLGYWKFVLPIVWNAIIPGMLFYRYWGVTFLQFFYPYITGFQLINLYSQYSAYSANISLNNEFQQMIEALQTGPMSRDDLLQFLQTRPQLLAMFKRHQEMGCEL